MSSKPKIEEKNIAQEGTDEMQSTLQRLEKSVNDSERGGLHARWKSGEYMLALRNGKQQLPKGVRAFLTDKLKLHRAEITARMKFAEKYSTDKELADVISTFRTWYAITHQALTDHAPDVVAGGEDVDEDSADNRRGRQIVERLASSIEELDPTEYDQRDVALLEKAVGDFRDRVQTLRKKVA